MHFSLAALAMASMAAAETVTYDWNVTWVQANPDGAHERKVIGINNAWPLPIVEVNTGDQLVANVYNGLGDKDMSIHWHGMFQNGTTYMDGASMVSQCPIPPGSSLTYNFTVTQNGSFWYHCHTDYCYPDGYRQAFVIQDPESPFKDQYDGEFIFTLVDWYHELVEVLADQFMSLYNPTGAEPIPDAFLVNDAQNQTYAVQPNTTYLMRIMNTGAFVGQYFYIEDHNMTIVEVDGIYTEPQEVDMLYLGIAQRYGVLVTTKETTEKNYQIVTVADADLLDSLPSTLQLNNTNWLLYNSSAPLTEAVVTVAVSDDLVPYDDLFLAPYDGEELLPEADVSVVLNLTMENLMTGDNYAMLNEITYTSPKVPSVYTAVSAGSNVSLDSVIYGTYTNPVVLEHNQVVEIVINNQDSGSHPFHLHGHTFQVLDRQPGYGADFASLADATVGLTYDANNHTAFPASPIRRDTIVVPPMGYVVLRFVADNPGVWIFHCHIDWHLSSGLAMLFIEAPDLLASATIPEDHYAVCAAASVPTVGNAAANDEDYTDLTGQNTQPGFIPDGWTPRGKAAMSFSVLSAVLGMISLVFYGMADLKHRPAATTPLAVTAVTEEPKTAGGSDRSGNGNGSEEAVSRNA